MQLRYVANGRLDVFALGSDHSLQHRAFQGNWSAWETLGGALSSEPCAVSWGQSRIDVFGSGATFVFHLRATRPGRVALAFLLKRRWEPTAAKRELVDIDAR